MSDKMEDKFEEFDLSLLKSGKKLDPPKKVRKQEPEVKPEVVPEPVPKATRPLPTREEIQKALKAEPVVEKVSYVEDPFKDIDISDYAPAPLEEADEDAIAETISASLAEEAEEYAIPSPLNRDRQRTQEEQLESRRYEDGDSEEEEDETEEEEESEEPEDDAFEDEEYEDEDYEDEEDESHSSFWKIAFFIIIGLILIAGCGIGGLIMLRHQQNTNYYRSHFLPGTQINGIDCSDKSVNEVEELLTCNLTDYTLTIEGLSESEVITAEDAEMTYNIDLDFQDLLNEQDHSSYRDARKNPSIYTVTTGVQVNEKKLRAKVESMGMFRNMKATTGNTIEYSYATKQYVLRDSVQGNKVDVKAVEERVIECFKTMQTELNLEEEGFYGTIIEPNAEVATILNKMNRAVQADISLDLEELGMEKITNEMLRECIGLDSNADMTFDIQPIEEWLTAIAEKSDTVGIAHVFTNAAGVSMTIQGGNFGWKMDVPATAEKLRDAILAGESGPMVPEYEQKGGSHGDSDIGNTYIEINLTMQKLYFFKEGVKVMEADIISGDVKRGKMTTTGVYFINGKVQNKSVTISGNKRQIANWMPYYGDVSILDASWRSKFGGEIYLADGSNGSIYLSTTDSAALYTVAEEGTPVVIYGGQTTYVGPVTETTTKAKATTAAKTTTKKKKKKKNSTTASETTSAGPQIVE